MTMSTLTNFSFGSTTQYSTNQESVFTNCSFQDTNIEVRNVKVTFMLCTFKNCKIYYTNYEDMFFTHSVIENCEYIQIRPHNPYIEMIKHDMFPEPEYYITSATISDIFVTSQNAVTCVPEAAVNKQCASSTQKGTTPMAYVEAPHNDKNIESNKASYLVSRLYDVKRAKEAEVHKAFNLDYPAAPTSADELVKAIKEGNYTIKAKMTDEDMYWSRSNPLKGIIWRSPDVKADDAGAKIAYADLEKSYKAAADAVMILPPAEGLAAIQALEAWTPTGAAN